jgi:hypothetical protein
MNSCNAHLASFLINNSLQHRERRLSSNKKGEGSQRISVVSICSGCLAAGCRGRGFSHGL